MIRKQGYKWLADVTVGGRSGKRYKRLFNTQAEAKRFEALIVNEHRKNLRWNLEQKQDTRRISELCRLWYKYHGQNLKDGAGRLRALLGVCEHVNDPPFCHFTKKTFLNYRAQRKDITANTLNHHHAYLNAVFNELARADEITHNPMAGIRKLKMDERELTFLTKDQIKILLAALKKRSDHAHIIAKICLATGTRWSEAQNLTKLQIRNSKIHLANTKSGKTRQLPITPALEHEVLATLPFKRAYSTFQRVLADSDIKTPKGQCSHILRHTFASHFMMNGGDILTLQKTLGHSDLKMTIRYAHLSPEHLEKITKLNPLDF